MKTKQKLLELRTEFERGQQQMEALDQRRAELREMMLRISGAIQVLEELVEEDSPQQACTNGENVTAPEILAENLSLPAPDDPSRVSV